MAKRSIETPALITSAKAPRSLDVTDRTHRYLWSMAVRVVCFVGGCLSPLPWNLLLFLGAAVIPGVAVILANAVDQRSGTAPAPTPEPTGLPALTAGVTVSGAVSDPHDRGAVA